MFYVFDYLFFWLPHELWMGDMCSPPFTINHAMTCAVCHMATEPPLSGAYTDTRRFPGCECVSPKCAELAFVQNKTMYPFLWHGKFVVSRSLSRSFLLLLVTS